MFFLWLICHGILSMLAQQISPLTPWVTAAGLLISTGLLVLFQPTLLSRFGRVCPKKHWFFLPHLLPVSYHLLRFGFALPSASSLATLLLSAALEELVFRGVLQNYFQPKLGILLSALVFSAAHLLGGFDPAQLIFAFGAGLVLGTTALDSLLPCILIHFLINLTANPPSTYQPLTDWLFWLCVAVYLTYGIYHLTKRCSYETIH